jgi:hypothetical protein
MFKFFQNLGRSLMLPVAVAVPTVVKNNDTVGNKLNALSKLPIPTIIAPAGKTATGRLYT